MNPDVEYIKKQVGSALTSAVTNLVQYDGLYHHSPSKTDLPLFDPVEFVGQYLLKYEVEYKLSSKVIPEENQGP